MAEVAGTFDVWRCSVPVALLAASICFADIDAAAPRKTLWFSPGPGTLDYVRLFEHPDEWRRARHVVDVFKFYQQHTQDPPPGIVGPNTYEALRRADAFRALTRAGIATAVEVGAVKEFYCTPDARGMHEAIAASIASIRAVEAAGGRVTYLAMDEPFVSGRARVCGGPPLAPIADRVATYVAGVHAMFPAVQIGLIEAYPFSNAEAIVTMLALLEARRVPLAFLHMDVDWHLSGADAFVRDMARLKRAAAAARIPFGIIVTGYNGDADSLYAEDVAGITNLIVRTFHGREQMPDHIIVQSWVVSGSGLLITPGNLPESRRHSHTQLLWNVFRRLRAGGPATGTAIPR